jgi:acyl carrier protein
VTKLEFYKGIAKILEVEIEQVSDDVALSDFEEWNSLSVIAFIAYVDEQLKFVVSPKELAESKTVHDLYLLVKSEIER